MIRSKYFLLTFCTLLLPFSMVMASIHIFEDVPKNAWYAPFVNTLVEKEIVSKNTNYRPADNMNLAEFIKLLIVASGKEIDTTLPQQFDDVTPNDWFYPYIQTAVKHNILSSQFSNTLEPDTIVERSFAAALILATFDLEMSLKPFPYDAYFSDMHTAVSYHDAASMAHVLGIMNGYDTGKDLPEFRPYAPINRAEVAKILTIAMTAKPYGYEEYQDGTNNLENKNLNTENNEEGFEDITENIEKVSTRPPFIRVVQSESYTTFSTDAAKNAIHQVLAIDIESNIQDQAVFEITLTHSGLGRVEDVEEIWIESFRHEGPISNISSFSRDTKQAKITLKPHANSVCNGTADITNTPFCTYDLRIHATFENNENNLTHQFSIEKPQDIQISGRTTQGNFPIVGETINVVNFEAPELLIEKKFSPQTVQVGSSQDELARFEFTNTGGDSNDDIFIDAITFKNIGNVDTDTMEYFALYHQNTRVTSFTKEAKGDNIQLFFLDEDDTHNGYKLENGDSKLFTLRANIPRTDGKNRNINIVLDDPTQNVQGRDASRKYRVKTLFKE